MWVMRAGMVTGGFVCALVILELGARSLDPPSFAHRSRQFDPRLGWTGRPGHASVHHVPDGLTHEVPYAFNHLGFRDVEPETGVLGEGRLLILGDSFTEALQVPLEATYWKLTADRLSVRTGRKWSASSLAVEDYGTVQELLTFIRFGAVLRPDVVVLQVFPLNDIANDSIAAAGVASQQDSLRPYLDPGNGFSEITWLDPRWGWPRRFSAAAAHGTMRLRARGVSLGREMVFRGEKERREWVDEINRELGWPEMFMIPILMNTFADDEQQLDMIRLGWGATEAAMLAIGGHCRALGAELVIVVVPHARQLEPVHSRISGQLPFPYDPHSAELRIARLMGEQAVVIPLITLFEQHFRRVYPYLQGHFNPAAHALLAEILDERVAELVATEGPALEEVDGWNPEAADG